jgi:hypothetical protein
LGEGRRDNRGGGEPDGFAVRPPRTKAVAATKILVNQVGYSTNLAKIATYL